MRIAIVTCKSDPDYIRAKNLRTGFGGCRGVETIVVKNTNKGLTRYAETTFRLIKTRITQKPDAYVLTFRGYEMLFLVLLIAGKKPVIYDEFINPIEWAVYEHHIIKRNGMLARLLHKYYLWLSRHCRFILSDTQSHADYSSKLTGLRPNHYRVVPISADEKLFYPSKKPQPRLNKNSVFRVFNYGEGMTPLYGLNIILETAFRLRYFTKIEFQLVGGSAEAKALAEKTKARGANIKYRDEIKSAQLPRAIRRADLALGGPFGNSVQAKMVVTGKTAQFLATGIPTIVGKNKVSTMFIDRVNSLVVTQASSQALAKQILWAYENRSSLKSIGRKGHGLYKKQFSNKVLIEKSQEIVDQLGSSKKI
ncbi:MAG TPA: hypothetical protein VMR34_02560 [Candidatus Saccharimonadales bacterium]|nr:hypothetical protein [Candidatus Saccharimonadales bacterium]